MYFHSRLERTGPRLKKRAGFHELRVPSALLDGHCSGSGARESFRAALLDAQERPPRIALAVRVVALICREESLLGECSDDVAVGREQNHDGVAP